MYIRFAVYTPSVLSVVKKGRNPSIDYLGYRKFLTYGMVIRHGRL